MSSGKETGKKLADIIHVKVYSALDAIKLLQECPLCALASENDEMRYCVAVPFNVPTDAKVSTAIVNTMKGPSARDYYASAVYYFEEGKDIKQAKEWIDQAIEMTEAPAFWQYRKQSLIYAKIGDKKGAIKAAKLSLKGAEKVGNQDYVKMNTDSLTEWGAM